MVELRTAAEVIQEVGGLAATARLTGRKSQHVWNWRSAGRFPADTFLVLAKVLEEQGKTAPASLWGIKDPEQAA